MKKYLARASLSVKRMAGGYPYYSATTPEGESKMRKLVLFAAAGSAAFTALGAGYEWLMGYLDRQAGVYEPSNPGVAERLVKWGTVGALAGVNFAPDVSHRAA